MLEWNQEFLPWTGSALLTQRTKPVSGWPGSKSSRCPPFGVFGATLCLLWSRPQCDFREVIMSPLEVETDLGSWGYIFVTSPSPRLLFTTQPIKKRELYMLSKPCPLLQAFDFINAGSSREPSRACNHACAFSIT